MHYVTKILQSKNFNNSRNKKKIKKAKKFHGVYQTGHVVSFAHHMRVYCV